MHVLQVDPVLVFPEAKRTVARPRSISDDPGFSGPTGSSTMVNYPWTERTSLQVNLNNLPSSYYYDQIHPGHIMPGAGFTALAGINFRF